MNLVKGGYQNNTQDINRIFKEFLILAENKEITGRYSLVIDGVLKNLFLIIKKPNGEFYDFEEEVIQIYQ